MLFTHVFRWAPAALAVVVSLPGAAWAGARGSSTLGVPSDSTTTVQARVVSSTPVVARVAVPVESCYDEVRTEAPRSSGVGAILGAIAGAAVGNAIGHGSGQAIATGVGLVGGAALGNHVETDGRTGHRRTVTRCEQQSSYENQIMAYDVVYEVNGQHYSTQLPEKPGRTLPVEVTVSPAVSRAPVAASSYEVDDYDEVETGYVRRAAPAIVIQSSFQSGGRWDRWDGERRYHRHHGHRDHRGHQHRGRRD